MFKNSEDVSKYLKQNPFVLAPMVDHSDLPFRMMTRKYGAGLCFTPMLNSKLVINQEKYRERMFKTCPKDRPLVLQLAGHDPETVYQAAMHFADKVDIIDLNLGCPQKIAKRGNYGAFLLEQEKKVLEIVEFCVKKLPILFSCKIRVFECPERTLKFCQELEKRGICMLTVHGRTRQQNKHLVGKCNWDLIKKIKNTLKIPVISNGGIQNYQSLKECLNYTGVDGVMSAEAILEYPALFDYNNGKIYDLDELAKEYLQFVQDYPDQIHFVKSHLFKMLYTGFQKHTDLRDRQARAREFEEYVAIVKEMSERRKGWTAEEKLGWYERHRKKEINELDQKIDSNLESLNQIKIMRKARKEAKRQKKIQKRLKREKRLQQQNKVLIEQINKY